ncbi:MAG TPA: DUF2232 domain-containing protein [Coleofasciculaceae cyanobacterium]
MSDPVNDTPASRPDPSEDPKQQPLTSEAESLSDNSESVDEVDQDDPLAALLSVTEEISQPQGEGIPTTEQTRGNYTLGTDVSSRSKTPLALVETAFLASTSSLIWLINYYFPLGPVLRIFFPLPIALAYLRWGNRASWMTALVSGLLLSVLMGPTRSILFFIPFGVMGVQLGAMWSRRTNWLFSILTGTLLGASGFFFRFWLLSFLLGEDLWVYVMTQITELLEWGFVKLGLLVQPSLPLIQAIAVVTIILNNAVYLFVVHLVALLMLDRLGNPIPRPPHWVQVLLDYEI